jgi:iron complex transport system ATP-binding protein
MLSAQEITFCRGQRTILDAVTGELRPGRVTALLGPNGAGKSTLLKLFAGELKPNSGAIEFDGKSISHWDVRDLAQRRAVLPQESHLAFAFPVREVVMMGRFPHLHGSETPRDSEIGDAALHKLELTSLANRPYPALSSGEKQRVQLARVLAQIWDAPTSGHRYLLLDEPTAGLDLAHQHTALRAAQDWAQAGAVVLAVMHDLNLAMTYADDAWVLENGRLVATGPVEEVLQAPLIERVFQVKAELLPQPNSARPFIITRPASRPNQ